MKKTERNFRVILCLHRISGIPCRQPLTLKIVTQRASYRTEAFICTCNTINQRTECHAEPNQTICFDMEVLWEPETSIFEKRMTQIQLVQLIPSLNQSQEEMDEWIVSRLDINLSNYLAIPMKTSDEYFRMDPHVIMAIELKCYLLDGNEKKSKRNGESSMRRVLSFVSPLHLENAKASVSLHSMSAQPVEKVSDHLNIISSKNDKYVKLQRFWSKLSNYSNTNGRPGMTNNSSQDSCAEEVLSMEDCSSDDMSMTMPCKACRLLCILGGYTDKRETSLEERLLFQKVRRYCPSLQRIIQQYIKQCPHLDITRHSKVSWESTPTDEGMMNLDPHWTQWLTPNAKQQQEEKWNVHELVQQLVETKVALAEALEQLDYIRHAYP
ncbi:uncharacterized protein Gasu_28430 [Galdieria sulphuraria]|uniref:Uncharacterized protein n=1 Tax=Galdieria sulphuraria TaxID=130081 RepID=M2Y221_GALSU|nr:uncharacterized protein Gasu_28430 [Galdieria sulphuraria]EME29844.1 hypothetical protein Gasu_28430 [Galdieria sulphuraria]|eukprot:XP_005706364.1 hypothetical protein Gasu_28430 [Galdieria sulphuraria]